MRTHQAMKILALFMGVMFLNMSFFLFELRVMDLQYTEAEMEEIISLVSTMGFEEEKDSTSGSSGSEEIPDLHLTIHPPQSAGFFLLENELYALLTHLHVESTKGDIATPPPKNI